MPGRSQSAVRLQKELDRFKKDGVDGILVDFEKSQVQNWRAFLEGPEGTPFAGGMFEVTMCFPSNYPFHPPEVKFVTKMYHPNVYTSGDICLDILQDQWQPTYTARTTLLSIQSLFTDPNPSSSANGKAGNQYSKDVKAYNREVKKFTEKYAMGKEAMAKKALLAGGKRKRDDSIKEEAEKDAKRRKATEELAEKERERKREEEAAAKKRAEEERLARRTPEEVMVDELVAEGLTNVDLIKTLLPIVGGDRELLKSLYADQNPE
eukprot:TRINITY_DN10166_c0_g2_i1.p1 TRINITY_DN10166_c0_g2~~TRINITY_DN10166_c0_g2_i1.p1  ORF type:complete len:264 (+),score=122.91 TRINITY_DN10166_c0_g2_i1:48-839(+)